MKGLRLLSGLILIGFFSSCSKNKDLASTQPIVGKWVSTAVYAEDSGQFNWVEANGFREFLTFYPDARFNIFTDVPGGNGTYVYNNSARSLRLHFQDQTGGYTREEEREVEKIDNGKMTVSLFSPQGKLVGKVAYERID
ncbi:MAG: hypothetical protein DI535_13300 [Citrobacter freundii]|nr:MAG: hypothetical protein DI535_13300 [Citrobacter freundii]